MLEHFNNHQLYWGDDAGGFVIDLELLCSALLCGEMTIYVNTGGVLLDVGF